LRLDRKRKESMILGMSIAAFTLVHVLLSLVGIGSGLIVMLGLIARTRFDRWTALFLASTLASCVTGFAFPIAKLTPAHVFGVLTLVALTLAIVARYRFGLAGAWRRTLVVSTSIALYLNGFIGVVQAFQKVPALRAIAPTQSEAPFIAAQLSVLIVCTGLAIIASMKVRDMPVGVRS
jgi:hypothetical protein